MDQLNNAVDAYNLALSEWERHTSTYYAWYEMDEPLTPGERRADEQLRRQADRLRRNLQAAQAAVIDAARLLRAAQLAEQS